MSAPRIPAIEAAIRNSLDHVILSERQIFPPARESVRLSLALVVIGTAVTLIAFPLFFLFMVVAVTVGAIHVTRSRHRAICVLAYDSYFLVLRSDQVRAGRTVRWESVEGPGTVVAVMERSDTLRPEERMFDRIIREIVVFNEGRMSVLMTARMGENEGIEILHRARSFFERLGTRPTIQAAVTSAPPPDLPPAPPTNPAGPPQRPRKGTLT